MARKYVGYNVYRAVEGCSEEFLGRARTMREARRLVAGVGLEASLWATARLAGHCGGAKAPEDQEREDPSRTKWCGRGGWTAIVPILPPE